MAINTQFRRQSAKKCRELLVYWRTIEFWLKRAEQVNGNAAIPAINELRYASRQLFNAIRILGKGKLNEGDVSVIAKRLIIAEQYLLNADHDIADAIIKFYTKKIERIEELYGNTAIISHYNEYPIFKHKVAECVNLIAESRLEYDKRLVNYDKMRSDHFPYIIDAFVRLRDAEIFAKAEKENLKTSLARAQDKNKILEIVSVVGTLITIASFIFAVFAWYYTKDDYCRPPLEGAVRHTICPNPQATAPLSIPPSE